MRQRFTPPTRRDLTFLICRLGELIPGAGPSLASAIWFLKLRLRRSPSQPRKLCLHLGVPHRPELLRQFWVVDDNRIERIELGLAQELPRDL